jgi:hypothetical protein
VALIPATDPSLGEKFYSYIDLTEWWEEGTGLENLLSIKPQLYNENKVSLDQPNFDAWIITDASLRIIYKDNVSNTNYKIDRITYEFLIKAPKSWEPYGYEKTAMMIRFAATMTGITGTPKSYVSTSNINPYLDFDAVNGIIGQGTTYTFDVPCPCEEKKSAAMR